MSANIAADDLFAFHTATGFSLAEAMQILTGMDAELRGRVLLASRTAKPGESTLRDPIERDPVVRRKVRQAREEAEELFKDKALGRCHSVWAKQAQILWDEHGIRWYSPAEMNPMTCFD
jgi:hypothetical protein